MRQNIAKKQQALQHECEKSAKQNIPEKSTKIFHQIEIKICLVIIHFDSWRILVQDNDIFS